MFRSKIVKKRTKNRETLLRNLRKGKARREARCAFQTIPYPLKFTNFPQLHRLYADLVLLEEDGRITTEASLHNHYKFYKQAQVLTYPTQKLVKFQMENKNEHIEDWRLIIERLSNSYSSEVKKMTEAIRNYCERYEAVVKEYSQELPLEKVQAFAEINARNEIIRQNTIKTLPCIELKSQLKNGRIYMTEISYSEKYLAELGYTLDEFSSVVFHEGLPLTVPLDCVGATSLAKMRLDRYLTTDPNGYQTPEFESILIMKNGFIKKVKFRVSYYMRYEKGVPEFVFLGTIVARQKPVVKRHPLPIEGVKLNSAFVDEMSHKEKEKEEFLSKYYNEIKMELKYTNLHKTCGIKEIGEDENQI